MKKPFTPHYPCSVWQVQLSKYWVPAHLHSQPCHSQERAAKACTQTLAIEVDVNISKHREFRCGRTLKAAESGFFFFWKNKGNKYLQKIPLWWQMTANGLPFPSWPLLMIFPLTILAFLKVMAPMSDIIKRSRRDKAAVLMRLDSFSYLIS